MADMEEEKKKFEDFKRKQELAADPNNVEFWQTKLDFFKGQEKNILGSLAEVRFLIDCFQDKINEFT